MLASGLLAFVAVQPDGSYRPDMSFGPMAEVSFTGPIDPGTRLRGWIVMRVRADAPAGAVIEARSGDVIRHVVRTRRPQR